MLLGQDTSVEETWSKVVPFSQHLATHCFGPPHVVGVDLFVRLGYSSFLCAAVFRAVGLTCLVLSKVSNSRRARRALPKRVWYQASVCFPSCRQRPVDSRRRMAIRGSEMTLTNDIFAFEICVLCFRDCNASRIYYYSLAAKCTVQSFHIMSSKYRERF